MGNQTSNVDGEKEVWSGGHSLPALYCGLILLAIFSIVIAFVLIAIPTVRGQGITWTIFTLIVVACAIILAGVYLFNRLNRWYILTSERLIHREGILVRRHHILELIRIDDVTYEQGPIEALLGCGSIFVASSDSTHPELELTGIDNVKDVADMIDSCRRNERKQRGLHVEAI